jgi:hypothetical protein
MADKKRDILEFFEQSNFEQFTPTRTIKAGTLFNFNNNNLNYLVFRAKLRDS